MLEYRYIIILNPQFNSFFNWQYCFKCVRCKWIGGILKNIWNTLL